jgi:hypothetical protein
MILVGFSLNLKAHAKTPSPTSFEIPQIGLTKRISYSRALDTPEFDLAADSELRVHFVWLGIAKDSVQETKGASANDLCHLYYSRGTADLKQWTQPIEIDKEYRTILDSRRRPKVICTSDGVHVFVQSGSKILHYWSADLGVTWCEQAAIKAFPSGEGERLRVSPLVRVFSKDDVIFVVYEVLKDRESSNLMVATIKGNVEPRITELVNSSDRIFAYGSLLSGSTLHLAYKSTEWRYMPSSSMHGPITYFKIDLDTGERSKPVCPRWKTTGEISCAYQYAEDEDPLPILIVNGVVSIFDGQLELRVSPDNPLECQFHPHMLVSPRVAVGGSPIVMQSRHGTWRFFWRDKRYGLSLPQSLPGMYDSANLFDILVMPVIPFGKEIYGLFNRWQINPEIVTGTTSNDGVTSISRVIEAGFYSTKPVLCNQGERSILCWRAHKVKIVHRSGKDTWEEGPAKLFALIVPNNE